jgi:hypothetical protein
VQQDALFDISVWRSAVGAKLLLSFLLIAVPQARADGGAPNLVYVSGTVSGIVICQLSCPPGTLYGSCASSLIPRNGSDDVEKALRLMKQIDTSSTVELIPNIKELAQEPFNPSIYILEAVQFC